MPERRKSTLPAAITIVTIVALLLSAYIGAYVWSLSSADSLGLIGADGWAYPDYPVAPQISEYVFYPAYRVDRLLRPERWEVASQTVPPLALDDSELLLTNDPIACSDDYDSYIKAGSSRNARVSRFAL